MSKGEVKEIVSYALIYSLGGILALILLHIFRDQNYLTGNMVLTVILIATVGSFVGIKIKKKEK